jgi:Resolvase, N terminal domain
MNVCIYARVSTKDKGQETENQLVQLRDFAAKQILDRGPRVRRSRVRFPCRPARVQGDVPRRLAAAI